MDDRSDRSQRGQRNSVEQFQGVRAITGVEVAEICWGFLRFRVADVCSSN